MEVLPQQHLVVNAAVTSPVIKNLPLVCSFSGVLLFFLFEYAYVHVSQRLSPRLQAFWKRCYWLAPFFYYAGFFNAFFNALFTAFFRTSYEFNTKIFDKGFLELLGPWGSLLLSWDVSYYLVVTPRYVIFFHIFVFFLVVSLIINIILSAHYILIYVAEEFGLFMLVMFLFLLDLLLQD